MDSAYRTHDHRKAFAKTSSAPAFLGHWFTFQELADIQKLADANAVDGRKWNLLDATPAPNIDGIVLDNGTHQIMVRKYLHHLGHMNVYEVHNGRFLHRLESFHGCQSALSLSLNQILIHENNQRVLQAAADRQRMPG